MNPSTSHLSAETLNALVDGELSPDALAAADRHLAECPACTRAALNQSLLRQSIARAGQRYAMREAVESRIRLSIAANAPAAVAPHSQAVVRELRPTAPRVRSSRFPAYGWAGALAAVLLVCAGAFVTHDLTLRNAHSSALAAEAVDQHIAAMAAAAPEVLSSDRHTVKPWFQGRLPFSFNLPQSLPPDIALRGANLVQVDGAPAAQLIFSIGKHEASVFLSQRERHADAAPASAERNGFHLDAVRTPELEILAVSDADPAQLKSLAEAVAQAQ